MAILTLAELRQHLHQVAAGATEDALLQDAVDEANAIVERYALPIVFEPYPAAVSQIIVYADGTPYLELPPFLAGSITEVRASSTTGNVVAATEYSIDGQTLRIINYYGYTGYYPNYPYLAPSWGRGPYYVTAKWGYGPAPADIVGVARRVAINHFQTDESGGIRKFESVEGNTIVEQAAGLSQRDKDILDNLKEQYRPAVTV